MGVEKCVGKNPFDKCSKCDFSTYFFEFDKSCGQTAQVNLCEKRSFSMKIRLFHVATTLCGTHIVQKKIVFREVKKKTIKNLINVKNISGSKPLT